MNDCIFCERNGTGCQACNDCDDGSNYRPPEAPESGTPLGQTELALLRRKKFLDIRYELAGCDWMRAVVNNYTAEAVVWLVAEVDRLQKLEAS